MELFTILDTIVDIIFGVFKSDSNKAEEHQNLNGAYEHSLKGTDKKISLDDDREYNSDLQEKQVLTKYGDQAITNDLSTMNDQPAVYQQ